MGILEDETAYVDFLCKHKITTNQFLILYLLYTERMVSSKKLSYTKTGNIYKYSQENIGWAREEVEDLIKKEFIVDCNTTADLFFDKLILTEKFSELMFIDNYIAWDELLDEYPEKVIINTGTFFLKAVDPDEWATKYIKIIKRSKKKHEEVIELVKWGVENGKVNMRIDRFILGRVWESLKKLRDEEGGSIGEDL